MPDSKSALLYLQLAHRDLKALKGMLDPAVFEDAVFGFHAQQATEKALKSLLCLLDAVAIRTHDLESLVNQAREAGAIDLSRFDGLLELTDFAVSFRYSAMDVELDLSRKELLDRIAAAVAWVEQIGKAEGAAEPSA